MCGLAAPIRVFLAWVIENTLGDKIFSDVFRASRVKSSGEYTSYVAQAREFETLFYTEVHIYWSGNCITATNIFQVWAKYNFDAIIAPVQSIPAMPHQ